MDRSSYFIENRALFGSFPDQKRVDELEQNGVRYFLDLTSGRERGTLKYRTNYIYENYPIVDRSCPENKVTFGRLIVKYTNIIKELNEGEKVYIHCRGGHGRSGLMVTCLLSWIHKISPHEAMEKTSEYHIQRKTMSDRWRRICTLQNRVQKMFILNFFKPVYITKYSESYLAFLFENIDLNLTPEDIFLIILDKIQNKPETMSELLNTGMGRIIFVSAEPGNRDLISKILNQVRTYLFQCMI